MKVLFKWILFVLIAAGIIVGGYYLYRHYKGSKETVSFRTEQVVRSDMSSFISATGTVEPEELVNVGAQVNGMVERFGLDTNGKSVDYGSTVTEGMLLAQIDDSLFVADLKQSEANKLQAVASIASAKANILQAHARFKLAETNYVRAQGLAPKGVMSASDFDAAVSEFDTAKANIAVKEADLELANAQLANAEATLARSRRNWEYCTIKSPVNGIIIDRRVSVGQTVNSSMNAPSLFLIAKDLRRMQVWVSVNEADVGQIKAGMPVLFSVDTFPGIEFKGEVQKVRLNATMSQNVVTFVVEVGTDNSDGKLLPYLTANVKFILDSRKDVINVPNSALRFTPDASILPPGYVAPEIKRRERLLWIQENNILKAVVVKTGLNDGANSEIVSGDIKEGTVVVTGTAAIAAKSQSGGSSTSPFMPTPPRRGGQRQQQGTGAGAGAGARR